MSTSGFDEALGLADRLYRPVHGYSFTGKLPDGMTIEVSEIAPAFGRPGGAIQVRFMQDGEKVTVTQLMNQGVLR